MPEAAVAPKEVVRYIEVEKKPDKPVRTNVWVSAPKSEWEWVEIPENDMLDYRYPDIMINQDKFESGKKHFVPPILAGELTRIMKRHDIESLSLLQPRKRQAVVKQMAAKGVVITEAGTPMPGER